MKSLSVTIQMKATEHYFPVMLFIMLYKVVLPFESGGNRAVLFYGADRFPSASFFLFSIGGIKRTNTLLPGLYYRSTSGCDSFLAVIKANYFCPQNYHFNVLKCSPFQAIKLFRLFLTGSRVPVV